YAPLLEDLYGRHYERLADLTIEFTLALSRELGITGTRFVRSSSLSVSGTKTDRLIALLRAVGGSHYISGPSARDYIDEPRLAAAGFTLEYMGYDYPPYEQLHPPYDPFVSVLDLLFMKGPEAARFIWEP
ncbi:MAG TPA: WbqC family protein, partial [Vicinamibacteria bacterium]|nr:WbqC family protein [Vicinamibacteria bacterium]